MHNIFEELTVGGFYILRMLVLVLIGFIHARTKKLRMCVAQNIHTAFLSSS